MREVLPFICMWDWRQWIMTDKKVWWEVSLIWWCVCVCTCTCAFCVCMWVLWEEEEKNGLWEARRHKEQNTPHSHHSSDPRNGTGKGLHCAGQRHPHESQVWFESSFSSLSWHQTHLEDSLKHKCLSPVPGLSHSAGEVGAGPQNLHFSQVPGDADSALPGRLHPLGARKWKQWSQARLLKARAWLLEFEIK